MKRRWFFGDAKSSSTRLAERLKTYEPYLVPFPLAPSDLTVAQAESNLAYLLAVRQRRLEILGSLLSEYQIDLPMLMAEADPRGLLDKLHEWSKTEWPKIFDPSLASTTRWLSSPRTGPEIVFSMLMDVAIVLGDLVVTRNPRYVWSLDLDSDNERDEMPSVRRAVVQIPKAGAFPEPIILDVESVVVGQYFLGGSTIFGAINELRRAVMDAVNGTHEAFWLEQAGELK